MRIRKAAALVVGLILCLVTVVCPFLSASAAATMNLSVQSSASGNVQENSVFTVTLKNNTPIAIAGFYAVLEYDSKAFSAQKGEYVNTAMAEDGMIGLSKAGQVIFALDADGDKQISSGDIATVQFVVKSGATAGTYDFTVKNFEIFNEAFSNLSPENDIKTAVTVSVQQVNDAINECIDLINAIGTVTGDYTSYVAIQKAKEAFKNLSNAEQELVSNYSVLQAAEREYAIRHEELLQQEHDKALAEQLLALHNKWQPLADNSGSVIESDLSNILTYNGFLDAQKPFDPTTQDIPEDWAPNYTADLQNYEAALSEKAAELNAALKEYKGQTLYIRSKLLTEKADMEAALASIKSAQTALLTYKMQLKNTPQAVKDYLTNNDAAISFKEENLKLDETGEVPKMLLTAIGDYDSLSDLAKALLINENAHVNVLYDAYVKMEAAADPDNELAVLMAGEYRKKWAEILLKTSDEVTDSDLTAINEALSEYNELPYAVKGRLTSQFQTLCNLLFTLTNITASLDEQGEIIYITQDGSSQTQDEYNSSQVEDKTEQSETNLNDGETEQTEEAAQAKVKIANLKVNRTVYILLIFIAFEVLVLAGTVTLVLLAKRNKERGEVLNV